VTFKNAAFALVCALSIVTSSFRRAHAKDLVEECMTASESGQKLRQKGKLSEAQTQFQICADSGCPSIVQRNCNTWVSEVTALLPSVTLSAKNAAGKDLINVTVMLDGKKLLEKLEGKAIPMDPGIHVFRFETAGEEAIDERIVLSEGEKVRRVAVRFGGAPEPVVDPGKTTVDPGKPGSVKTPTEVEQAKPGIPALAFVLGGAGVLSIGVGAALYISGSSSFPSECDQAALFAAKGDCPRVPPNDPVRSAEAQSQAQSSDNQIRVGTWSMVGGGALLTGAVIWIVLDRTAASSRPPRTKGLLIEPSIGWKTAALKLSF
jgi:hypothetical protein